MNTLLNGLIDATNYGLTTNGAVKHLTTKSAVLDLFALCGSYRNRADVDCINMFKNAVEEDMTLALKCLFYLRDCRGGQGERRFFRVCFRWLANNYPDAARRNIDNVAEYGRWDDLVYSAIGTKVEIHALVALKKQFELDLDCKTPSLLGKWLPSENASARETKRMANLIRCAFGMSHKEYRQALSALRERINIVERLMSQGEWDKIEFDKLPSRAGIIYKNAFARRDIIAKKYTQFAKDENTTVNAGVLYPYEIVHKAYQAHNEIDRMMIEKYWENQIDVLEGKPCKMLCVCDTSGSMRGTPLDMAIGLSMYCAERIGGPFKNYYISFSSRPQLIKIEGVDFVDKVLRIYRTNLCENTNIKATFDMLKKVALTSNPEDIPEVITIISDMQIDAMTAPRWNNDTTMTEMEKIRLDWEQSGLKCPRLVYWNVNARQDTILDMGPNVSFVSGASPMTFKQVITGKTGWDLMIQTICSSRYDNVK